MKKQTITNVNIIKSLVNGFDKDYSDSVNFDEGFIADDEGNLNFKESLFVARAHGIRETDGKEHGTCIAVYQENEDISDSDKDTYDVFVSTDLQSMTIYNGCIEAKALKIIEENKELIRFSDYVTIKAEITHQPICHFCGRTLAEVISNTKNNDSDIIIARGGGGICLQCANVAFNIFEAKEPNEFLMHPGAIF
ncbi:hypothetical protein [Pelosinus propionicus]|uniref:Uncharacterized protein n=1 Tax=Pelosinus propionicus DSM 13327 TaxID=1123291 RepID=A0A1I4P9Y1_9FIRM|nr:hypothetical protein [Pelosinus propionicus]SFM24420.1 hypothetical protein SAMN04490355_10606 [Pelosinus propionicus DSM 13327]